ncbi:MAG TPA: hypothetical protein VN253_02200 [Kofleriaceae bacterium]|nr:hypothetical protein [Kofleriaceae bacterium]
MRSLRPVGSIDDATLARLALAARPDTLEEVLRWSADLVDVIVQDEFTHDVIVREPAGRAFVVFDTT